MFEALLTIFGIVFSATISLISIAVALFIYIRTEQKNRSRTRTEQLLIFIEKIYSAYSELAVQMSLVSTAANSVDNSEDFLGRVISISQTGSSSIGGLAVELRSDTLIASRILDVYPEPNLQRILDAVIAGQVAFSKAREELADRTSSIPWSDRVAKFEQIRSNYKDAEGFLRPLFYSNLV